MNYKDFLNLLRKFRLINEVWGFVIEAIYNEMKCEKDLKESFACFILLLFVFIDDGNICISLDENTVLSKWHTKLNQLKISSMDEDNFDEQKYNELKVVADENIQKTLQNLNIFENLSFICNNNLFVIEENWLYTRKFYVAKNSIEKSIRRIFKGRINNNVNKLDVSNAGKFPLAERQIEIIEKGINRNLIITGGPGTGKTTSVLYLLISLLNENNDYEIYLAAPSGKAANRMKESIIDGSRELKPEFAEKYKEILDQICSKEEATIHRLLETDPSNGSFRRNKNNQFNKNSIFVIDEASMIDVCLFASLLEAIPEGARIFIMGDKNQLPSVECGAVFGELLDLEYLKSKDSIVELNKSQRFSENSEIYWLADAVNNGTKLPIDENKWESYKDFKIKSLEKDSYPVFYYKNHEKEIKEKEIIYSIVKKWYENFFKNIWNDFNEVDLSILNDINSLQTLYDKSEPAKILCGSNKGAAGVDNINQIVRNFLKNEHPEVQNLIHYPSEIMMINKNNKLLDLYNGDTGVLIKFKNDSTLYFMLQKTSLLIEKDGYVQDKIFKIGKFVFYPLRMISKNEIDTAYAISIHKSQGSGYKNILVTLPSQKGHPLLNRQIIYTAITRTKGNTYIVSNIDRLNEAKDTILKRDTNLR